MSSTLILDTLPQVKLPARAIRAQSVFLLLLLGWVNFLGAPAPAVACPSVAGYVDFNCDRRFGISVTGDSIVKGVKDGEQEGGYVGRVRLSFPQLLVQGIGVPGITSDQLLRAYKKRMSSSTFGYTKQATFAADLLIIDVGRNDYWTHTTPAKTVQNIRRIVKLIRQEARRQNGSEPYIVVARLLATRRPFQQPFVNQVNYLLSRYRGSALPTEIDFSKLSALKVIGEDGVHPNAEGYKRIAHVVEYFVRRKANRLLRLKRPDQDHDGIADFFERTRYHTDSLASDSDHDGFSDGSEVFTYSTNPLDTASNPLTLTPVPVETPTPTPTPPDDFTSVH